MTAPVIKPSAKPTIKPNNPRFSSGPCSKRPGWTIAALEKALLGRSHRSAEAKSILQDTIDLHREIMGIPDDYRVGIMPGSNTGAFEAAMWCLLGQRGVDVLAWENFSQVWAKDAVDEMKLKDLRSFITPYGEIPNLAEIDTDRDVIFPWNGTTSGVAVPHTDWIKDDRKGLTLCDATSAVFGYDMPWDKLDVTTWSWQKVLGGEAAHGMIVLSPRAVERLETYKPAWPIPKLFRLTKKGKLDEGIFKGSTINTPSLLAVEDCLDALRWVQSIGGQAGTIQKTKDNAAILDRWIAQSNWVDYLAADPAVRSRTSICLKLTDPDIANQPDEAQEAFVKNLVGKLATEGAAYDINAYRTAPPGLRIWCGSTVEKSDLEALLPWLDWAYAQAKADLNQKAA